MPVYTTIVANAGDFKWKPLSARKSTIALPVIKGVNGLGYVRTVKIGTVPNRQFTLDFESGKKTYDEVLDFLLSKGFGHEEFTWRNPEDNILYTVRQDGELAITGISDNTDQQNMLSYQYSVTLVVSTDVQGL